MLIDAGDSLLARVTLLRKGNSLQKTHHTHLTHVLVHVLRFSRMLFQRQSFSRMRDASDTNHWAGAKNGINTLLSPRRVAHCRLSPQRSHHVRRFFMPSLLNCIIPSARRIPIREIIVSCDGSRSRRPSCKLRAECLLVCYWGILKKVIPPPRPSSSTWLERLTRRCPLGWGQHSGGCAAPAGGWTLAGTRWDVSVSQSATLNLIVKHRQRGKISLTHSVLLRLRFLKICRI